MRSILKASAVMGASSIVTMALGVVRQKYIAVELGPDGIGTLGLLTTALALGTALFGAGLGSSGIRFVASAKQVDEVELERTRSALVYSSHALGIFGAALLILLRDPLASLILEDAARGPWMAWMGVALWFSIASAAQLAVINGMRRISDLALTIIAGNVVGTVATLLAVAALGEAGLVASVIAPPLATTVFAWGLLRNVSLLPLRDIARLWPIVSRMVSLGLVISASLLLGHIVQFYARILIRSLLSLADVGYFQASWSIAKVYMGFLLTALAAEYYPRISALAGNKSAINREVNIQIRIVLLLAGPVIIATIIFAPIAVTLLYSDAFHETIGLLRWQLVGDVLKVASWALGFLLLAREARWKFMWAEVSLNAAFLLGLILLLPQFGLVMAGIAYAFSYLVYLLVCYHFVHIESGFSIGRVELLLISSFVLVAILTLFLSSRPEHSAFAANLVLLLSVSVLSTLWLKREGRFSFRRLFQKAKKGPT